MKQRLVALDNLRGLAALVVVLTHTWVYTSRYEYSFGPLAITEWLKSGAFSIHIFIILSGFVLAYPLVMEDGWKKLNVRDFAVRRALRIVPPYYAMILLSVVIFPLLPTIYNAFDLHHQTSLIQPRLLMVASHLTFTRNFVSFLIPSVGTINGSFWSIEVEVAYYISFPLIMYITRRWGVLNMVAGALLLTGVWRIFIWQSVNPTHPELMPSLAWSIPGRFFEFALGILAAMIVYRYQKQITASLALLVSAFVFWVGMYLVARVLGQFHPITDIVLGLSGFFLVLAVCGTGLLSRVFTVRPLTWIGTFSYSIYLVHEPIIEELYTWFPKLQGVSAFLTYTVGFTAVCLLVAYLFYLAVERPIIHWGRRVARRQQAHTPADPALEQPVVAAASEQHAAP